MNLVEIYNNQIISRKEINSIDGLSNDKIIELTRSSEKEFKRVVKKFGYKVCANAGKNLFSISSVNQALRISGFEEKTINKSKNTMSFYDFCTDYLNLDPDLMSEQQLNQARTDYKN